jgi:hypothetical protein
MIETGLMDQSRRRSRYRRRFAEQGSEQGEYGKDVPASGTISVTILILFFFPC